MPANSEQTWEHAMSEEVVELTEAVLTLTEQVRMLRLSLDEIEQELGWAIRTRVLDRLPPPSPTRVTSMPLDPLAEDFHERVNAISPADLPIVPADTSERPKFCGQGTFW